MSAVPSPVPFASDTTVGIMSTSAQTFAGLKTFTDGIVFGSTVDFSARVITATKAFPSFSFYSSGHGGGHFGYLDISNGATGLGLNADGTITHPTSFDFNAVPTTFHGVVTGASYFASTASGGSATAFYASGGGYFQGGPNLTWRALADVNDGAATWFLFNTAQPLTDIAAVLFDFQNNGTSILKAEGFSSSRAHLKAHATIQTFGGDSYGDLIVGGSFYAGTGLNFSVDYSTSHCFAGGGFATTNDFTGETNSAYYMNGATHTAYIYFDGTNQKFAAASGKHLFAGALGVGNSASASVAVGTLAKKIEVFDAAGSSLGFVPVYTSIT